MKKNIAILLFLFGSISFFVNAQSPISSSIASRDHRCCSASFSTTDNDGLPTRYTVFRCAQILGNSATASEDAYNDACESAQATASLLASMM